VVSKGVIAIGTTLTSSRSSYLHFHIPEFTRQWLNTLDYLYFARSCALKAYRVQNVLAVITYTERNASRIDESTLSLTI